MSRRQAFVGRDGELAGVLGVVASAVRTTSRAGPAAWRGRRREDPAARRGGLAPADQHRGLPRNRRGLPRRPDPHAPLVAALRSLLARLPRAEVPQVLGTDPGNLGLLLPELGAPRYGRSDQARLVAAVSTVLDRAAELRPVVLVLDDLHCADVATLEVLAYLCAGLDRQRIAVVVAFRPDEVDDVLGEWLQEVRRAPHVLDVALGPMTWLRPAPSSPTWSGPTGPCSASR